MYRDTPVDLMDWRVQNNIEKYVGMKVVEKPVSQDFIEKISFSTESVYILYIRFELNVYLYVHIHKSGITEIKNLPS